MNNKITVLILEFLAFFAACVVLHMYTKRRKLKTSQSQPIQSQELPRNKFAALINKAIQEKNENDLQAAFNFGKQIGFDDDNCKELLRLLEYNWHKLHFSVIESLKNIKHPHALERAFKVCVDPPEYLQGKELELFIHEAVDLLSLIGGIEAYRSLAKIATELDGVARKCAESKIRLWAKDTNNKRYPTIYSDSFTLFDLQHIESLRLLRKKGCNSLMTWAREKFINSKISDKLIDLAIINDLSYDECKSIVDSALEASSLQYPSDDLYYNLLSEQMLIKQYTAGLLSASELLSNAYLEYVIQLGCDVKFQFWARLDAEIDTLQYGMAATMKEEEISAYLEKELRKAFMIP